MMRAIALFGLLCGVANAQSPGTVNLPSGQSLTAPQVNAEVNQAMVAKQDFPAPAVAAITGTAVQAPVTGAIGVSGVFQQILAVDANRKGCLIPNISNHVLYVFAVPPTGSMADATTAKSIPVAPSGSFNCVSGGTVITNEIDVTTSTVADPVLAWFAR